MVGTQDGMHALILCSDGFTMHYFRQNQEPKSGSPTPMHPKQMAVSDAMIATPVSDREKTKLEPGAEEDSKGATQEEDAEEGDGYDIGQVQELGTLIMDMDNRDQCWALRRVGAEGHVLLLRAIRPAGFNTKGLGTPRKSVVGTISITRLSNLVSKETVAAFANTAGSWQTFYSCPIPVDEVGLALVEPPVVPLPAASSTPLSASKVDQKSTPRLPPKTGERKRKPEMPPRADSFSTPAGKTVLATPSMQTAAGVVGGVGSRKAPRISPMEKGVTSALLTPSASPMPASIGNLPAFARSASKEESGSSRGGGGGGIAMSFSYDDSPSRPAYEPIVISPPPVRIPKAYSNAIIPVPAENWSEDAKTLHNRVQEMFKAWQLAVRPIVDRCHERQKASTIQTLSKHTQQITMTGLNQINKYLNATIQELERRIKRNLSYEVLGKDWVIYQQSKQLPSDGLLAIVERHRNTLTDDVMPRLRVELNGAAARDMIFAQVVLPSGKATELSMRLFRDCVQDYEEMVEITQDLVHQMQQAAKQSFPAREKLRIDMEDMEQHPSNLVI